MSENLYYKSIKELSSMLEKKIISSVELTKAIIDRTNLVESKIQAFLSKDTELAISEAKASDLRRSQKSSFGFLDGIPIGIKDNIATLGQSQSCGSRILENYISPYQSTVSYKLKEQGVVFWGRLNMDEFAMGSSTEYSAYKETANPWNTSRIPGGSSGGSAASVAAGEVIASLGSDTGGSIRQPASLCGVVGLKPTYGRVSRYGLAAFASSLDQIGPLARSVEDIAYVLQVIAGYDSLDSTSIDEKVPNYLASIKKNDNIKTIGVPKEYFTDNLSSDVRKSIEEAIKFYSNQGFKILNVSLPHMKFSLPVYHLLSTAEASSNLARYDGVRYTNRIDKAKNITELFTKSRSIGFGDEVKRRILLGTHLLSSGYYDDYYLRAQKIRTLIRKDFINAFKKVDALITPTTPSVAYKKGYFNDERGAFTMDSADIYTVSVNLSGLPSISLPCGFSVNKLPIGLQLIGKPFAESDILYLSYIFEQAHEYYKTHPVI